jgi:hypothetical protein
VDFTNATDPDAFFCFALIMSSVTDDPGDGAPSWSCSSPPVAHSDLPGGNRSDHVSGLVARKDTDTPYPETEKWEVTFQL